MRIVTLGGKLLRIYMPAQKVLFWKQGALAFFLWRWCLFLVLILCIDEFVCKYDNRSLKTVRPLLRHYMLVPTQTWNSCSRMLQAVDCLQIGRTNQVLSTGNNVCLHEKSAPIRQGGYSQVVAVIEGPQSPSEFLCLTHQTCNRGEWANSCSCQLIG